MLQNLHRPFGGFPLLLRCWVTWLNWTKFGIRKNLPHALSHPVMPPERSFLRSYSGLIWAQLSCDWRFTSVYLQLTSAGIALIQPRLSQRSACSKLHLSQLGCEVLPKFLLLFRKIYRLLLFLKKGAAHKTELKNRNKQKQQIMEQSLTAASNIT